MFFSKSKEGTDSLTKVTNIMLLLIAIVVILIYSEEYVIPFIIALLVWFIIHELRENLQMIPFVRKKFPIWVQSTIAFLIINIVLFIVMELLYINMSHLTENMSSYQSNLDHAMLELNDLTGFDVATKVKSYEDSFDFMDYMTTMVDTATLLFGDAFLILIYVVFLLVEESIFHHKLKAFYPSEEEQQKKVNLFHKMDKNIGQYLRLKTLVSFVTAILSYVCLLFFDVDAPVFWAMLIFVLNFIPTVGSLIATFFPAIFVVLQTGELAPFLYVLLSVGFIQVVVGNIVEPKIMGDSLNMSSLVVILSLTIWGAIWGVMGMILSVPITVMMIIVFEEIPSLRFIAIMLSEKGKLNIDQETEEAS